MAVRVVLADDHQLLREGVAALLDRTSDIEVIAAVEDGVAAVDITSELRPDVVLMDVSMPVLNGIEATRSIVREQPAVRVVVLSMHADPDTVSTALAAGASGYLLKGCAAAELVAAVRSVAGGRGYLTPAVTGGVLRELSELRSTAVPALTPRERVVLQLIAEGHSTGAIAQRLEVSVKTVGTHREHLMAKVGVRSVAGLTKYAVRQGVTTLDHGE